LPLSARETNNEGLNGMAGSDPTYSATVGSIKLQPHRCKYCHRQYASNAKLLQHQRKKHQDALKSANDMTESHNESAENIPNYKESAQNVLKEKEDVLSREWDIFTTGASTSSAPSSKSFLEATNNSCNDNIPTEKALPSSSNLYLKQQASSKNNTSNDKDSNYSDDEENAGVALQYIVHDNGDLEVVQRVMPSASFSDRRSVDTPLPPEEVMSPHPDAMECANANMVQTPIHNKTRVSEEQFSSNQNDNRINETVLFQQKMQHRSLPCNSSDVNKSIVNVNSNLLLQQCPTNRELQQRHSEPVPISLLELSAGRQNSLSAQRNNETGSKDVLQLTPVPQSEAMRLINKGATIIHVPAPTETTQPTPTTTPSKQQLNQLFRHLRTSNHTFDHTI
jgi:hypothetical protein